MSFVRKVLLPVAGVIALALIVMIASPRAAHALAAALVQVANTPNTAVPTVQAPAANQIAAGHCEGVIPLAVAGHAICYGPAVPADKTLVIETTSVDAYMSTGHPPVSVTVGGPGDAAIRVPMIRQGDLYSGVDHYVGTLVGARVYLAAGKVPQCLVVTWSQTGNSFFTCDWSGYYVPAH